MAKLCLHILLLTLAYSFIRRVHISSVTFTLVNQCSFTVWPGHSSSSGMSLLTTTRFALETGESSIINAPPSWGGRFWGRTNCSVDNIGRFSCVTGNCGSSNVEYVDGAIPSATLAELVLNYINGLDFYDVSLVNGFNLPILMVPEDGSGDDCTSTGCVRDLNGECPPELRVVTADIGEVVACKSACEAFRSDEYCCTGANATADKCGPSRYSRVFKSACPRAYSYAFDDATSTFTCSGADYVVTFCPSLNNTSPTSSSGSGGQNSVPRESNRSPPPSESNTVDVSVASSACTHVLGPTFAVASVVWRLYHLF